MKLALGTAQFGMDYGVANQAGRVSEAEAKRILCYAATAGIDTLDTAAVYGRSEEVLGIAGVSNFRVISKLPPRNKDDEKPEDWVIRTVESSLSKLRLDCLHGLMLHRPLELLNADGKRIYAAMLRLKEQGFVKQIGASVYSPSDLEQLIPYFNFDLIQAPMNILDRRMEKSGWINRLQSAGIEVHIRSVFLQGLLLMEGASRPSYFKPWENLFGDFENWLAENELGSLEACLGFLDKVSGVDRIVVGVDNVEQLVEIISAISAPVPALPGYLHSEVPELINPALWKL